jgi:hypothetical protein
MATLDEVVEVLNSKHWKWWKDNEKLGEIDWENVRVELIDIFHFMLSMSIQINTDSLIYMNLVGYESGDEHLKKTEQDDFFKDFWDQMLLASYMKSLPLLIARWIDFWYRAGGNAEMLFREYYIKAALNLIRQDFGYNQNKKYIKMWPHPKDKTKTVEDNVVAHYLATDIEISRDTLLELKTKLNKYYLENVSI